jgi:hypothetical protein
MHKISELNAAGSGFFFPPPFHGFIKRQKLACEKGNNSQSFFFQLIEIKLLIHFDIMWQCLKN